MFLSTYRAYKSQIKYIFFIYLLYLFYLFNDTGIAVVDCDPSLNRYDLMPE